MRIRKSHEHVQAGSPFLLTLNEAADEADMLLDTLHSYIDDNEGPDLYKIDGQFFVTMEDLHDWLKEVEGSLGSKTSA